TASCGAAQHSRRGQKRPACCFSPHLKVKCEVRCFLDSSMSFFAALEPFPSWLPAAAFLLGLLVGNGLTTLIVRLPVMMTAAWERDMAEYRNEALPPAARFDLLRPGPHCPQCRQAIAWTDRVPVLGWL